MKKITKKLELNKSVISSLKKNEMNLLKVGGNQNTKFTQIYDFCDTTSFREKIGKIDMDANPILMVVSQ